MVIISQSSARYPGNSVWKRAVLEEVTSPLSHSHSTAFREGSHVDRLMGMPFNGPKDSKDVVKETRDGPGAHTRVTRTPTTFNPVPKGKTISLKQFRIIAPRVTGINPVDIRRILRGFESRSHRNQRFAVLSEIIDVVLSWMAASEHPRLPEIASKGHKQILEEWASQFDYMHFDEMLEYSRPELSGTKKNYIKRFALGNGERNEYHLATQTHWSHAKVEALYEEWKASHKSFKFHVLDFWEGFLSLFKRKPE
ncbi:hypothetical protein PGT21_005864 [Puccinia graminis f. sp. tritici]|uniref:Uncharacterized protein n=2 Tax=Puccinia graminis f. sp. tritici TaxID=56615 RepID=A0A5B0LWV6_PUCGR|nr:hypothetical protein PGT21_005864 [Puccinia graminis f. sp. tritici]